MNFLLINNHKEKNKIKTLENFLLKYGVVEIVHFERLSTSPLLDITNFDCVVFSGSSISPLMYDDHLFLNEMEFIRKIKIPIIGICFGFELLAKAYGEKLIYNRNKIKGICKIKYLKSSLGVWENHYWSLRETSKFKVLGKSKFGIEVMQLENKFGIQFHPEHEDINNQGYLVFGDILKRIRL